MTEYIKAMLVRDDEILSVLSDFDALTSKMAYINGVETSVIVNDDGASVNLDDIRRKIELLRNHNSIEIVQGQAFYALQSKEQNPLLPEEEPEWGINEDLLEDEFTEYNQAVQEFEELKNAVACPVRLVRFLPILKEERGEVDSVEWVRNKLNGIERANLIQLMSRNHHDNVISYAARYGIVVSFLLDGTIYVGGAFQAVYSRTENQSFVLTSVGPRQIADYKLESEVLQLYGYPKPNSVLAVSVFSPVNYPGAETAILVDNKYQNTFTIRSEEGKTCIGTVIRVP